MPDPSEPGREWPERPDSRTHAPDGLRRRILARVNSEPEPVGPLTVHRARLVLDSAARRRAALAASICAVGAIGLAIALPGGWSGGPDRPAHGHAPESTAASLVRTGNRAELHLVGMPQPPVGEVYEVWLAGAGQPPRPTDALFTPTGAGTAAVEIPGSLRGIRAITVTAEPRGGSNQPTGPVVLRVNLTPAAS